MCDRHDRPMHFDNYTSQGRHRDKRFNLCTKDATSRVKKEEEAAIKALVARVLNGKRDSKLLVGKEKGGLDPDWKYPLPSEVQLEYTQLIKDAIKGQLQVLVEARIKRLRLTHGRTSMEDEIVRLVKSDIEITKINKGKDSREKEFQILHAKMDTEMRPKYKIFAEEVYEKMKLAEEKLAEQQEKEKRARSESASSAEGQRPKKLSQINKPGEASVEAKGTKE
ncbi:hypothetical protein BJ508DRAFT_418728 [Ascobolus immersus RN42]|uniref:Uncharacterized protein n=1 Tax=Ascobolus immersus RN42 TaxID=1160509 RepID=A0A3N4HP30_ASCIM|nr:hypothetical protein BJ508DRAFT_418728 [Ascobolus immersus RN42]